MIRQPPRSAVTGSATACGVTTGTGRGVLSLAASSFSGPNNVSRKRAPYGPQRNDPYGGLIIACRWIIPYTCSPVFIHVLYPTEVFFSAQHRLRGERRGSAGGPPGDHAVRHDADGALNFVLPGDRAPRGEERVHCLGNQAAGRDITAAAFALNEVRPHSFPEGSQITTR